MPVIIAHDGYLLLHAHLGSCACMNNGSQMQQHAGYHDTGAVESELLKLNWKWALKVRWRFHYTSCAARFSVCWQDGAQDLHELLESVSKVTAGLLVPNLQSDRTNAHIDQSYTMVDEVPPFNSGSPKT